MKIVRKYAAIALIVVAQPVLAQYQPDWNYKNFYEEVTACRNSVVFPTAKDYEAAGVKAGQSKEELRGEIIAITPVFESIASAECFCALNELAKDKTHQDYKKNPAEIAPYLEIPRCKTKMTEAAKVLNDKQKAKALMLQQ